VHLSGQKWAHVRRWCAMSTITLLTCSAPSAPDRGIGAAKIMPTAKAAAMNERLQEIGTHVAARVYCIQIYDGAGRYQTAPICKRPIT
jgi:hypothetical protein